MILTETSNANAVLFLSPLLEKKKPLQQLVEEKNSKWKKATKSACAISRNVTCPTKSALFT